MAASGSKQYGLIKTGKKASGPAAPSGAVAARLSVFNESSSGDEESAGPTEHWSKLALKAASHGSVQAAQTRQVIKKAMQEDAALFQYDEVYDDMKQQKTQKVEKKVDEKPRYMKSLLESADRRRREQERRMERRVQRERDAEGDEFADKEAYVTSAYKQKLLEREREEEEERRKQQLDELTDVTKQKDLSGFYRHMYRRAAADQQPAVKPEPTSPPPESTSPAAQADGHSRREETPDSGAEATPEARHRSGSSSSPDRQPGIEEGEPTDKAPTAAVRKPAGIRKPLEARERQYRRRQDSSSPSPERRRRNSGSGQRRRSSGGQQDRDGRGRRDSSSRRDRENRDSPRRDRGSRDGPGRERSNRESPRRDRSSREGATRDRPNRHSPGRDRSNRDGSRRDRRAGESPRRDRQRRDSAARDRNSPRGKPDGVASTAGRDRSPRARGSQSRGSARRESPRAGVSRHIDKERGGELAGDGRKRGEELAGDGRKRRERERTERRTSETAGNSRSYNSGRDRSPLRANVPQERPPADPHPDPNQDQDSDSGSGSDVDVGQKRSRSEEREARRRALYDKRTVGAVLEAARERYLLRKAARLGQSAPPSASG